MKKVLFLTSITFLLAVNSCFAQFITNKDQKYGLLDSSGAVILEPRYDTVYQVKILYYKSKVFAYIENGLFGLYNSQDKTLTPVDYNEIVQDRDGAILFRKDSLWGFVSESEKFMYKIVSPVFKEMYLDGPGHNPFGFADRDQAIRESFIGVFNGKKWGLLNYSDGDTIVDFISDNPIHSTLDCDHYSQNKKEGEVSCTFYCKNGKSKITLPTYFADIKYRVFNSFENKLFLTYYFTSEASYLIVFNYFDGRNLFFYKTNIVGLDYQILNEELIYIKQEETVGKTVFYKLMVYNMYSNKLITEYKTRNYDANLDIITFYEDGKDKDYICLKLHMNARPKKLVEL